MKRAMSQVRWRRPHQADQADLRFRQVLGNSEILRQNLMANLGWRWNSIPFGQTPRCVFLGEGRGREKYREFHLWMFEEKTCQGNSKSLKGLVCWNVVFWRAFPKCCFSTAYATHQMVVGFGSGPKKLTLLGAITYPLPWIVGDGRSYLKVSVFPITGPGHKKVIAIYIWHVHFFLIPLSYDRICFFSALTKMHSCKESQVMVDLDGVTFVHHVLSRWYINYRIFSEAGLTHHFQKMRTCI